MAPTYIYLNKFIMTTKLILTVEERVIRKATSYAEQTGISLSELVENYLDALVKEEKEKKQVSSKLQKIIGVVKLPQDFDKKTELRAYFDTKHL